MLVEAVGVGVFDMVTVVLAIGTINLGLGFGLALLLEHPWSLPQFRLPQLKLPRLKLPRLSLPKRQPRDADLPTVVEEETGPVVLPTPAPSSPIVECKAPVGITGLPPAWEQQLRSQAVHPKSLAEAVLWISRFELPKLREQILRISQKLREPDVQVSGEEISAASLACQVAFRGWIAASSPASHSGVASEFSEAITALFSNHNSQIDTAVESIVSLSQSGGPVDRAMMLPRLDHLAMTLETLRDRTGELLAGQLRREKRLTDVSNPQLVDNNSTLLNRLGIESVIADWLVKDPDRVRLVSGVLVDLDHCAALNEQFGSLVTDQIIASFGDVIKQMLRQERGFDRAARISGQAYFLFLGDTGLRNATSGAERIRQNIEATSFKVAGQKLPVSASFAVAEWHPQEPFETLMERLQSILLEAKKAGRNRTCVSNEVGIQVAKSAQYQVKARELDVGLA